ncbi:hypothetical protein [Thiothrix winogradskyi]|uniref:DUF551 domain-containing protein n=1 Tax=Thiothrix winogradskyi TaxID=96472 RepID=A0ABY3SX57_9GAMM|nr:hypothetical protein [Thiothrix winogradskyi]UJS23517.1 hypothetical protein L2Y54_16430 [Thiothrix winogradskyi]
MTSKPNNRVPVQISVTSDAEDGMWLVALCNDGTLWRIPALNDYPEAEGWQQYPPIPQPRDKTFH